MAVRNRKWEKSEVGKLYHKEYSKKYHQDNIENISERQRLYRKYRKENGIKSKRHYDPVSKKRSSESREKLGMSYLKKILKHNMGISEEQIEINPQLIELKRVKILTSRLKKAIKKIKNENNNLST